MLLIQPHTHDAHVRAADMAGVDAAGDARASRRRVCDAPLEYRSLSLSVARCLCLWRARSRIPSPPYLKTADEGRAGANSDYYRPGVDAEHMGNELRMINDYRGVPGATGPNCKFSRTAIRGFRAALIVAIRPIAVGEELLLDYGAVYWDRGIMPRVQDQPSDEPASPGGGEGAIKEQGVSVITASDLEALENDIRDMAGRLTKR